MNENASRPPDPWIAVIGAGAIGVLVAAYLAQCGLRVTLVARSDRVREISANGLKVSGIRGPHSVRVPVVDALQGRPDIAVLCVKTSDIECAMDCNLEHIRDALIVTVQNGVRADDVVARYVPHNNIVSSAVMFVSSYVGPGTVIHNAEGSWVLGDLIQPSTDRGATTAAAVLRQAFAVSVSDDLRGMKHLKTFLNANNCIAAIVNVSLQQAFSDLRLARLAVAIWREGYEVVSRLGIRLVSLPGFPVQNLTGLMAMPPSQAAAVLSTTMTQLSQIPIYGSILQSIRRGRPSEVDFINGEFAALARENGSSAPLNSMLADLVHRAEQGFFLTADELVSVTETLVERLTLRRNACALQPTAAANSFRSTEDTHIT